MRPGVLTFPIYESQVTHRTGRQYPVFPWRGGGTRSMLIGSSVRSAAAGGLTGTVEGPWPYGLKPLPYPRRPPRMRP